MYLCINIYKKIIYYYEKNKNNSNFSEKNKIVFFSLFLQK